MNPDLFNRIYETVVRRETTYDGIYYTGVRSTRIVCRPSCRAKTPLAKNVTFYPSLEEAIKAGFRPCKRCRPDSGGRLAPDAALAAQVDALLETRYGERLTLPALAAELAMSPFHLQRTYRRVRGCTPAAQLDRVRLDRAMERLAGTDEPIAAIGSAVGFRSPSHFSAWFCRKTGAAPHEYRMRHYTGGLPNEQT